MRLPGPRISTLANHNNKVLPSRQQLAATLSMRHRHNIRTMTSADRFQYLRIPLRNIRHRRCREMIATKSLFLPCHSSILANQTLLRQSTRLPLRRLLNCLSHHLRHHITESPSHQQLLQRMQMLRTISTTPRCQLMGVHPPPPWKMHRPPIQTYTNHRTSTNSQFLLRLLPPMYNLCSRLGHHLNHASHPNSTSKLLSQILSTTGSRNKAQVSLSTVTKPMLLDTQGSTRTPSPQPRSMHPDTLSWRKV